MVDLSLTPNPDDRALWPMGSDADWIRGSDVANNEHPGVLAQRHQWIVPNRLFAESMVKANSELVTSIIGALLSWRTCTVDQLRAGLSVKGAPEFHRDEPNLYGALCRLGVIDIGFSPYERFSGQIIPQTWLSLSSDKKLIRSTLGLFNSATWLRRMLSDKQLIGMRRHVRHNTYATVGERSGSSTRRRSAKPDCLTAVRRTSPHSHRTTCLRESKCRSTQIT